MIIRFLTNVEKKLIIKMQNPIYLIMLKILQMVYALDIIIIAKKKDIIN